MPGCSNPATNHVGTVGRHTHHWSTGYTPSPRTFLHPPRNPRRAPDPACRSASVPPADRGRSPAASPRSGRCPQGLRDAAALRGRRPAEDSLPRSRQPKPADRPPCCSPRHPGLPHRARRASPAPPSQQRNNSTLSSSSQLKFIRLLQHLCTLHNSRAACKVILSFHPGRSPISASSAAPRRPPPMKAGRDAGIGSCAAAAGGRQDQAPCRPHTVVAAHKGAPRDSRQPSVVLARRWIRAGDPA